MTRADLILRLASKYTKHLNKDADLVVRVILDAISDALSQGKRTEIRDFGSFTVNRRPTRKARNPRTGKTVIVPAKCVPHFRAGAGLRERVGYKKF